MRRGTDWGRSMFEPPGALRNVFGDGSSFAASTPTNESVRRLLRNNRTPSLARQASIEWPQNSRRSLRVRSKPDAPASGNAVLNGRLTLQRANRLWWWSPRLLRNDRTPSLARQASIEWPQNPWRSLHVRLKPDAQARGEPLGAQHV